MIHYGNNRNYNSEQGLRAVFILNSNITVNGGTGTENDPYILGDLNAKNEVVNNNEQKIENPKNEEDFKTSMGIAVANQVMFVSSGKITFSEAREELTSIYGKYKYAEMDASLASEFKLKTVIPQKFIVAYESPNILNVVSDNTEFTLGIKTKLYNNEQELNEGVKQYIVETKEKIQLEKNSIKEEKTVKIGENDWTVINFYDVNDNKEMYICISQKNNMLYNLIFAFKLEEEKNVEYCNNIISYMTFTD